MAWPDPKQFAVSIKFLALSFELIKFVSLYGFLIF
jgi:hypothetical protein